jgi:hypothetical protein
MYGSCHSPAYHFLGSPAGVNIRLRLNKYGRTVREEYKQSTIFSSCLTQDSILMHNSYAQTLGQGVKEKGSCGSRAIKGMYGNTSGH